MTTRILPIGDSITAQARGYRAHLHAKLAAVGLDPVWLGLAETTLSELPGVALRHDGFGGERIDQIAGTLTPAQLSLSASSDGASGGGKDPDFVLLLAGTNDLAQYIGKKGAGDTTWIAAAVARELAFVDRMRGFFQRSKIIVSTVPVLVGRESERAIFNAQLARGLFARRFGRVSIAKGAAAYTAAQTLDGTHPDTAGANGLALSFFREIAWGRARRAVPLIGGIALATSAAAVLLSK